MEIVNANLSFKGSMKSRAKTNRIILHHAAAIDCSPQQIHKWHLNNRWSGAGYHFLVRKDGNVYSLRPEDKVGAHASGFNSDSIGICFEGNFMTEIMSDVQKNSGKELVAHLKNKYGISKVQKHKDVCSTSCPGDNFPFDEISGVSASTAPVVTETKNQNGSFSGFGGLYRCNASKLNVRSKPDLSGNVVASYRRGETVKLDNWYRIADGYVWGRYTGASSGKLRYVAVGKATGKPEPNDYLIKVF